MLRACKFTLSIFLLLCTSGGVLADPWPIENTGAVHEIWTAYGQWQETGGIHLHEGIDLKAPEGTAVKAVRKGTIVNINADATDNYNDYMTIADFNDATKGWGYVHMKAKAGLSVGDAVNVGDVIGNVTETAGLASHLHFERDSNKNGGWPNAGGGTEHLDDDPLLYLNPDTDNTAPTISAIKYRRGEDEGKDVSPKYFTATDCNNFAILGSRAPGGESGNVDVIPSAYDKFGAFAQKLSVQSVTFHALGRLGDNTPLLRELVDFEGNGANDFAQSESNNFSKIFRDSSKRFAQAIYENDSVADSKEESEFWYIVTNQDDDQKTEATDDNWFWDTDGVKTEAWNDQISTDERAANNAKTKFRDDFYDIYINVDDEANNVVGKKETVLVDNWEQTVAADRFHYFLGDDVKEASGAQYQESDGSVPLYVVDSLASCVTIPSLGIESTASTSSNADGDLAAASVWTADKLGWFYLISDYDDDGMFHDRLDASDPFLVLGRKWFYVHEPPVTTPDYPGTPIVIDTALQDSTIPIETVTMALTGVDGRAGEIWMNAYDLGAPTGPTDVGFQVLFDPAMYAGDPLPDYTELNFNLDVVEVGGVPGTLVDLDGSGSLVDATFSETNFSITWEVEIPESLQYWLLEGEISEPYIDVLEFAFVDAFVYGADSVFDYVVALENLTGVEIMGGELFHMTMSANYVPEPHSVLLVLFGALLLVRRRSRTLFS